MPTSSQTAMKRLRFPSLSFLLVALFICPQYAASAAMRSINTPGGGQVEIPVFPRRIACFYRPAYDKIVMLSDPARIALMPRTPSPWAAKFHPGLKAIPSHVTGTPPDVERLLKLKIDLVFYPKGHVNVSKVLGAGIPAVCPFNDRLAAASMEEHVNEFGKQILFFGDILGPEARVRAEKYVKYMAAVTERVKALTAGIPESKKPKVYYGRAANIQTTQGNNTIMKWCTELAGGIYLPGKLPKYFADVNTEQIAAWDPDIVLLGMYGTPDTPDNPLLKTLKAGKAGRIYRVPAGMFYWDMTSSETALLPLFLGKKFHPDVFKDWDLVKELKRLYGEVYRIKLSTADAERIINALPPR